MCWPARPEVWGSLLHQAEEDYATIAHEISAFEPVTMIATESSAHRAAELCGSTVTVTVLPIDDSWARDSGPIYVTDIDSNRTVLDWTFNSWGEKFTPYDNDARLVERWCRLTGDHRRVVDMVFEGGSVTLDGDGTLVTTEQCLLHPNRNPTLSRRVIEDTLREELGVSTVLWLPVGLALDDDTDGHVDNVAAFCAPGRILIQGCDDPDQPDHDRMSVNRRCLVDTLDARGRVLDVVEIPVLPFTDIDGEIVAVPYLNLYICNGGVIVPVCGNPADSDMLALIGDQFPGRKVVPVPGATVALGGGGPHCITQQVPASAPGYTQ